MSIKEGSHVYYTAPHGAIENGIVKSINESGTAAFVVYKCNEDWDNYKDYTAQHTIIGDLSEGWWAAPTTENTNPQLPQHHEKDILLN